MIFIEDESYQLAYERVAAELTAIWKILSPRRLDMSPAGTAEKSSNIFGGKHDWYWKVERGLFKHR